MKKIHLVSLLCIAMLVVIILISSGSELYVFENHGKHGFVNQGGKVLIHAIYSDVKDFSEGLAAVKVDSKWGFINKRGRIVINPIYHNVESFNNGKARIQLEKDGGWGYIDKRGKITWVPTK